MSASRRDKRDDKFIPTEMADVFKALSDPSRLRILYEVSKTDVCVHELCKALHMSQTSVSHHLRQLRAQHLVNTRRAGREIFYMLASSHVTELLETARRHVESD